jgi:hypothetical protein
VFGSHEDQVDASLHGLVYDGVSRLSCLEKFALDAEVGVARNALGPGQDILAG